MEKIILSPDVRLLVVPGDGYRESVLHQLCPTAVGNSLRKLGTKTQKSLSPKAASRLVHNIKMLKRLGLTELVKAAQQKYHLSPLII
ncbi:hypothetical protein AAH678_14950 [Sodalis endosymbiont of Spalangia cameroni]|uniref:hypothetical protein n=1 Tax=Sodalis praecaptivus TaxID=1239307 RepID=UPI0031F9AF57